MLGQGSDFERKTIPGKMFAGVYLINLAERSEQKLTVERFGP